MKNLNNLQELLTNQFNDVVIPSLISVPYTTIVNRAQIKDVPLKTCFGVERVMTQDVYKIPNEMGPNGETIYGVVGDKFDAVRLIGEWSGASQTQSAYGSIIAPTGTGLYSYEITFYGTGLNLLLAWYAARDLRYVLDSTGSSFSANILVITPSAVINSRNYSANQIVNVVSNLSLGWHTIRFANTTGNMCPMNGYEVLIENVSGNLTIVPGSAFKGGGKDYLVTAEVDHYKAGVVGTRGANVIKYLKDGAISQVVTETNISAAFYPNADHANEEMVREYFYNEFACGRGDDFGGIVTNNTPRAFTLDDNLTTLMTSAAYVQGSNSIYGLGTWNINQPIIFTFYGTGLDILFSCSSSAPSDIYVDGVLQISALTPALASITMRKICSGLPLGTHTIKLNPTTSTGVCPIVSFQVYAPKNPSLPVGAIALSQFYVNADFVANTVATQGTMSTGVIRKQASQRESVFVNTWTLGGIDPATYVGGWTISTAVNGGYIEKTEMCTGFELRGYGYTLSSTNIGVYINGLLATVANFPTLMSSFYGYTSFSAGILNSAAPSNASGAGLRISGLPYGKYTIKFLNNTAVAFQFETIDIITPIYSPKPVSPYDFQNTLPVGNCSLSDLRKTNVVKTEENGRAFYKTAGAAGTTFSSSTATYVPVNDLSLTVYSKGGMWELSLFISFLVSSAMAVGFRFVVDGKAILPEINQPGNTVYYVSIGESVPVYLSKGVHKIDIYFGTFSTSGPTITITPYKMLTAKEL
jgi:hypothetical protein